MGKAEEENERLKKRIKKLEYDLGAEQYMTKEVNMPALRRAEASLREANARLAQLTRSLNLTDGASDDEIAWSETQQKRAEEAEQKLREAKREWKSALEEIAKGRANYHASRTDQEVVANMVAVARAALSFILTDSSSEEAKP